MLDAASIHRILQDKKAIVSVPENASVAEVADLMEQHNVGCVVVLHDDSRVVGIISERDIVKKVVARKLDPTVTQALDVMTCDVVHCSRTTPISEAQHTMAKHEIRHLPIIENDMVVGMISSRDILNHQLSSVAEIARGQMAMLHRLERIFPALSDSTQLEPATVDAK